MSERLTTLEAWAAKRYGEHAPSIFTLRRWVKAGRFSPRPKKHGRKFFMPETAELLPNTSPPITSLRERRRAQQTAEPQMWRRLGKIHRVPAWADRGHIRAIYDMAARVSRCTGMSFHVDHAYPARGRSVSGLHVGCNLRLLPARANYSKGNR
jgi:hypothetical protein